jgi:hypothetical protein
MRYNTSLFIIVWTWWSLPDCTCIVPPTSVMWRETANRLPYDLQLYYSLQPGLLYLQLQHERHLPAIMRPDRYRRMDWGSFCVCFAISNVLDNSDISLARFLYSLAPEYRHVYCCSLIQWFINSLLAYSDFVNGKLVRIWKEAVVFQGTSLTLVCRGWGRPR